MSSLLFSPRSPPPPQLAPPFLDRAYLHRRTGHNARFFRSTRDPRRDNYRAYEKTRFSQPRSAAERLQDRDSFKSSVIRQRIAAYIETRRCFQCKQLPNDRYTLGICQCSLLFDYASIENSLSIADGCRGFHARWGYRDASISVEACLEDKYCADQSRAFQAPGVLFRNFLQFLIPELLTFLQHQLSEDSILNLQQLRSQILRSPKSVTKLNDKASRRPSRR